MASITLLLDISLYSIFLFKESKIKSLLNAISQFEYAEWKITFKT